MTLHEIVIMAQDGLIGLVIILLGLVKIPKVDLNLWTILARVLGRAMNGELTEKVNKIGSELEAHIQRTEVERINQIRQRIIRFSDEIMYDTGHSQEHYNDILEDINKYEQYCKTHPDLRHGGGGGRRRVWWHAGLARADAGLHDRHGAVRHTGVQHRPSEGQEIWLWQWRQDVIYR